MRRRRVRTEKQSRDQVIHVRKKRKSSNPTGKKRIAKIMRSPGNREKVTLNVAVATVNSSAIVKVGNHKDIGLIISRAGFEPALPFAHVVRGSQICVPIAATDLQTTELV